MVLVREIAQAVGAQVVWEADAQRVIVKMADRTAAFVIGAEEATVNGQGQPLESAAVLKAGRAMLPLKIWEWYEQAASVQKNLDRMAKEQSVEETFFFPLCSFFVLEFPAFGEGF